MPFHCSIYRYDDLVCAEEEFLESAEFWKLFDIMS